MSTSQNLGTAKSDAFMLSTASVMLGMPADLFKLNETNSLGLVKNFAINADHSYTDLTQGVKNSLVYSVLTGSTVKASMEVFEYTMQNIAYGLGLEGAKIDDTVGGFTHTVGAGGALAAPAAGQLTAAELQTNGAASGVAAGEYLTVTVGNDVFLRKVVSAVTSTITVDRGFPIAIPVGAAIKSVSIIGLGSKDDQPFLAAKVTGTLANGDLITIMIPKLRVVKGFNLAFSSKDFGNMPFEFSVFDLTPSDPFYDEFLPFGNAMLLA